MSSQDQSVCCGGGSLGVARQQVWLREAGLAVPVEEPVEEPPAPPVVASVVPVGRSTRVRRRPDVEAPRAIPEGVRRLILVCNQCPGDAMVMSAAIESLHIAYPGQFVTDVRCSTPELYDHSPLITHLDEKGSERIVMEYPLIHASNSRPVHFMEAYCDYLGQAIGLPLTCQVSHPAIYMGEGEKDLTRQVEGRYWVINAGSKPCFTTKQALPETYQGVVDRLAGKIQFVQIGSAEHLHKPLRGVIDLIGRTSTRELVRLTYHAQGGVGPTTFLQHLFAAHARPYVHVDSAREPASWLAYPTQTSLVRHGTLPCCARTACWVTKVEHCQDKWGAGSQVVPRCMAMISADDIASAILRYEIP